jgi:hypothetical protein
MSTNARMNLARTVRRHSHADEQLYVKHASEGSRYNGRWEPGEYTLTPITAAVQPVAEAQRNEPEGVRSIDDLSVFAIGQLAPTRRQDQLPADLLVWQDEDYEVVELRDYSKIASYWEARIRRVRQ